MSLRTMRKSRSGPAYNDSQFVLSSPTILGSRERSDLQRQRSLHLGI